MDVKISGMDIRTQSHEESQSSKCKKAIRRKVKTRPINKLDTKLIYEKNDIPDIIHQVWIDCRGDGWIYPKRYNWMRKTLRDCNPNFDMKVWFNIDIMTAMDDIELRKYKELYINMRYPISKADFARFIILYIHGGWYMDLDFEGKRSLSDLRKEYKDNKLILTLETEDNPEGRTKLYNGFIAAPPRDPFILGWIDCMSNNMRGQHGSYVNVIHTTGPRAFYKYATESIYPWRDWIVSTRYIIPHNTQGDPISESIGSDIYDGPYVCTHWREGTKWSNSIVKSTFEDGLQMYTVYIVCITFLIVIIFGWDRGMSLSLSKR